MHFKVKIGYDRDDFISISEEELETAIRAQVTGRVGIFKEGTVGGNHIIAITPDFQKLLGVARDYKLTGEDYSRIGTRKTDEYTLFLNEAKEKAVAAIDGKKPLKIEAPGKQKDNRADLIKQCDECNEQGFIIDEKENMARYCKHPKLMIGVPKKAYN